MIFSSILTGSVSRISYFETFAPDAVLHPFGFGLGYTTHEITGGAPAAGDDGVSVRAGVRNTGGRPGSAVVQLYVSKPDGALSQPARELVAFARTAALEPGAAQTVELDVPWRDLASYDDSGATGHRVRTVGRICSNCASFLSPIFRARDP